MRLTNLESLERAVRAHKADLEKAEADLKVLLDEKLAARLELDKKNAVVAGRVLWRLMQEEWKTEPSRELVDKERLGNLLRNGEERKAFGLTPLPRAVRKGSDPLEGASA